MIVLIKESSWSQGAQKGLILHILNPDYFCCIKRGGHFAFTWDLISKSHAYLETSTSNLSIRNYLFIFPLRLTKTRACFKWTRPINNLLWFEQQSNSKHNVRCSSQLTYLLWKNTSDALEQKDKSGKTGIYKKSPQHSHSAAVSCFTALSLKVTNADRHKCGVSRLLTPVSTA